MERINVSFPEINTALEGVGRIGRKHYRLRHPGVALGAFTLAVDLTFLKMFERLWLTPEFVPPETWEHDPASG